MATTATPGSSRAFTAASWSPDRGLEALECPAVSEPVVMSAAALEALQREIARLEGEERRAIAERIRIAREWGDLKENSEYHDAKRSQAMLETRILQLRDTALRADLREERPGGDVA